MRLSVVKQSFFGPPGQYGRLVSRANYRTPESDVRIGKRMIKAIGKIRMNSECPDEPELDL